MLDIFSFPDVKDDPPLVMSIPAGDTMLPWVTLHMRHHGVIDKYRLSLHVRVWTQASCSMAHDELPVDDYLHPAHMGITDQQVSDQILDCITKKLFSVTCDASMSFDPRPWDDYFLNMEKEMKLVLKPSDIQEFHHSPVIDISIHDPPELDLSSERLYQLQLLKGIATGKKYFNIMLRSSIHAFLQYFLRTADL